MNAETWDKIGNWNPQLYREIKGRFKPRNLLLASLLSAAIQALCISPSFLYHLPDISPWEFRWRWIYIALNWLLPIALLVIGVYLISNDVYREQQRGTLNFVRLSPQESEKTLLGKLLGVPILLYLGVALALPLHFYSGLIVDISPLHPCASYILWGALGGVFYNFALLAALAFEGQEKRQFPVAGVTSLLTLITAPSLMTALGKSNFIFFDSSSNPSWTWYFLPPSCNYFWLLGTLFILNSWLWRAANRCFRHPNATLISKAQSYWIIGITQLWFLGFALPSLVVNQDYGELVGVVCLFAIAPLFVLLMAVLLSPSRQTLLDWARYRHWQKAEKRGLLRDLLLGEKSPSPGAIASHWAIIGVLWLPWLILWIHSPTFSRSENDGSTSTPLHLFFAFILTALLCSIYATVYQRIRFHAKTFNRALSRAFPWVSALLAPSILIAVFRLTPAQAPLLWLFTPLPDVAVYHVSAIKLLFAFTMQSALLAFLTRQLQRQLKQAGASEFKRQTESKNASSSDRATVNP